MKALILKEKKAAPVYEDFDLPEIQKDFLKIEIHNAALNHRDVWITKGLYPGIKCPTVLGSDGAGVYHGKSVLINPGFNWGNFERAQSEAFEILGMPSHGTFAEVCQVPFNQVHPIPRHLSKHEGAALPLAGVTAYRALVTKCNPKKGEVVLISGIGGGVALFAFQFAMALGCDVYVTSSSEEKIEKAIRLGAKGGFNYKDDEWTQKFKSEAGGADIIIDSAAGDGFADFLKISNLGARIAFYGGSRGTISALNPQTIFWKQISIYGSTMGSPRDFDNMLELVSAHEIRPIIDDIIPLSLAHEGFHKMEKGNQFGKIIFDLSQ